MKQGKIITLISVENARKGYKFLFEGQVYEQCKLCPLYNVCIGNLEKGRVYEVINVRKKKHKCKALNMDLAVVEVREAPLEVAIRTSYAIEGAIITFHPINCSKLSCINYELCSPIGLKSGDKCKIVKIYGKIDCPRNLSLTKALINRCS